MGFLRYSKSLCTAFSRNKQSFSSSPQVVYGAARFSPSESSCVSPICGKPDITAAACGSLPAVGLQSLDHIVDQLRRIEPAPVSAQMNGWTVTHQFSGLADVQTDLLGQPQSKGMAASVWSQLRIQGDAYRLLRHFFAGAPVSHQGRRQPMHFPPFRQEVEIIRPAIRCHSMHGSHPAKAPTATFFPRHFRYRHTVYFGNF